VAWDTVLIAGGGFGLAGGDTAHNVASWNGFDWTKLGSGLDGWANAVSVFENSVVAGGYFTMAGGKVSPYLAQWTKSLESCPVVLTGDANHTGDRVTSDIIYLVNYVLKGGPTPIPCAAVGDVNCNGSVATSDIIYLVNSVLKAGPAPCDVCPLIPAIWTCP
jgi:hypothetical protein